ncbi:MAG: hypothetical protein ACYCVD_02350 [Desulfitobacteriaceae bacterium]
MERGNAEGVICAGGLPGVKALLDWDPGITRKGWGLGNCLGS